MLYHTTLNLLPPNKKTRLDHLVKFIFARNILEIILFIYTLLAIVLVWSWLVLQENFNSIAESATTVSRENTTYNREVRSLNTMLRQVVESGKQFTPVSPKINELIGVVPDNIKLGTIELDRATGKFSISGTAVTRADLLSFKSSLESVPWLKEITSPTAELFQKDNVSFQIFAKLQGFAALPTPPKAK